MLLIARNNIKMEISTNSKIENCSTKKLQLISYNPHKRPQTNRKDITISVNAKVGMMMIGKQSVIAMNMENTFIHLYYDVFNNTIAWKLQRDASMEEIKIGWKYIKVNKQGAVLLGVKTILNQFKLKKEKYLKLPVKRYKETGLLERGDYYFIEIK